MSNFWKIYMLAVVSFLVGTSEFIIAGILDKVAKDTDAIRNSKLGKAKTIPLPITDIPRE